MVVVVTAIFGICWLMSTVVYNVEFFTESLDISLTVNGVISDTMVLFNSAVNPFVYALLNRQFKDKMKRIICCTGSTVPMAHTVRGAHNIKLANHTTHPSHTAGPCFQEWCVQDYHILANAHTLECRWKRRRCLLLHLEISNICPWSDLASYFGSHFNTCAEDNRYNVLRFAGLCAPSPTPHKIWDLLYSDSFCQAFFERKPALCNS